MSQPIEPTTVELARLEEALSVLDDDTVAREVLAVLSSQGPYPTRCLLRAPADLIAIAADFETPKSLEQFARELEAGCADADTEELHRAVRRYKRRESLRIFYREVEGLASLRETTAEIADLAAACAEACLRRLSALMGRPELADSLCVLGMGKLGGRELNFSSDVDLMYLASAEAAEDPATMQALRDLAVALTDALGATTADGYVFRVDLRLRPEGTQGPLVQPPDAMVAYYLDWGRTWERSAMMKARPIAGSHAVGHGVLERLEPFIYRRYLDFSAVEELRRMKAEIEANARASAVHGVSSVAEQPDAPSAMTLRLREKMGRLGRSGGRPQPRVEDVAVPAAPREAGARGWDVKIGAGGIREIEFFVQALQLVHCGTRPKLRVKNTLDALDHLLWSGLINHDDHTALADAYDLYRRLEHRVQMADDRQTHVLPALDGVFAALAARMRTTPDELESAVLASRAAVGRIFGRLFDARERSAEEPTVAVEPDDASLDAVMTTTSEHARSEAVRQGLARLGFSRPTQVAGQIQVLRDLRYGPLRRHVTGAQENLGRRLVRWTGASPEPDVAFGHLARFYRAVGDRPGFWGMLADNPHATQLLCQVFGSSSYLSQSLIRDPNIFERLLSAGTVAVERSEASMKRELADRLEAVGDPEHRLGIIRRFHREETLRIGLHETAGAATIAQTTSQLAVLAEVVVGAVLFEIWEPLRTRRRRPGSILPPVDEIPFCILAFGKLGGRELGFGSDLDIAFVYEEDRQWRLEHTFFARLAQRLVRALTSASEEGKLYEVDTRLRPSGSQGALVVSAEAFAAYHRDSASLWERQALLRMRPLLGTGALRARMRQARAELAFGRPLPDGALQEIAAMRDRIRGSMYTAGTLDVKFGPGGLLDLEFMTQALQLVHGASQSAMTWGDSDEGIRSQSTATALRAMPDVVRRQIDVESLVADFFALQRVQARLRMTDWMAEGVIPDEPDSLETLARRMGHQGSNVAIAFRDELARRMARIDAAFHTVVDIR